MFEPKFLISGIDVHYRMIRLVMSMPKSLSQ